MEQKIMEILQGLRSDIDFEKEERLIDDGLLDSFDIIGLVGELNDAFDISINVANLVPENFNSASAMAKLVETLKEQE